MQNITFPYEVLDDFCIKAFSRIGFDAEESRIITDVLLTSDLYGIESHGMQRIVRYHKGIEKGLIDIKAKPSILIDTPVSAVIDAHNSMGQLVGHSAMKKAIEKAKSEYRKYQTNELAPVERAYLETVKDISEKAKKK